MSASPVVDVGCHESITSLIYARSACSRGAAWRADPGSATVQPAYVNRPVPRPATKLMGGTRGTPTHYNSVGEPVAFSTGGVDSDDRLLRSGETQVPSTGQAAAALAARGAHQAPAEAPASAATDPRSDHAAAPPSLGAAHKAPAAKASAADSTSLSQTTPAANEALVGSTLQSQTTPAANEALAEAIQPAASHQTGEAPSQGRHSPSVLHAAGQ